MKFWAALLMAFFLIPIGALTGLFAEFIFNINDDIPYEQLRAINPGRWNPVYRAINTTIVAYVLAFILAMDILKVGVGSVLLNDYVSTRPFLSLTIGFITGFAFPYVRDLIQEVRPAKREATPK